jgi:hypothetical protein
MRVARLFLILLGATGTILAVGAAPAMADTQLGGPLYGSTAYPNVRGHADYESGTGHRDFHLDLWNAGKLAGKTLAVYAGGHKIGTMRVGSGGRCGMHRDTDHGQYVPTLSAGATVAVKTGTGRLVASGTLRRMHMM